MDDPAGFVGLLVWAFLIGTVVYMTRFSLRAQRWQREGRCARCGVHDPTRTVGGTALCVACAHKTRHRNRLGYRFFLGMGIVGAVIMTLGTLGDVRAGGSIDVNTILLMFSLGVAGPIGLALWVRRQNRTEDDPDE